MSLRERVDKLQRVQRAVPPVVEPKAEFDWEAFTTLFEEAWPHIETALAAVGEESLND